MNEENKTQQTPAKKKEPFANWWIWLIIVTVFLIGLRISSSDSRAEKETNSGVVTAEEAEHKANSLVRTYAQEIIKKMLKTPKSAEFPILDEWTFEDGEVSFYKIAHAYVDYENTFGTEVRSYFDMTVRITDEGYQAVRIVFDGEMVYEDKITIACDITDEQGYEETEEDIS